MEGRKGGEKERLRLQRKGRRVFELGGGDGSRAEGEREGEREQEEEQVVDEEDKDDEAKEIESFHLLETFDLTAELVDLFD